jgi:hypothetical protein
MATNSLGRCLTCNNYNVSVIDKRGLFCKICGTVHVVFPIKMNQKKI